MEEQSGHYLNLIIQMPPKIDNLGTFCRLFLGKPKFPMPHSNLTEFKTVYSCERNMK